MPHTLTADARIASRQNAEAGHGPVNEINPSCGVAVANKSGRQQAALMQLFERSSVFR